MHGSQRGTCQVARRRPPRVVLLITTSTPMVRARELQARLARQYRLARDKIETEKVDSTCETPSALVAEYGAYLYADAGVGSVAPNSTKLVLDWGRNWALKADDFPGRSAPLFYCKIKPERKRR
jgi:hypothetical protein